MASRYAQALEQQRRFARWLASPEGVRVFFAQGTDAALMRQFYHAARLTLAAADPYHWVPEMCGLLTDVSAEMPPWTLRREALPTDHGFCWFEEPLPIRPGSVPLAALSWGLTTTLTADPDPPERLVITAYGCQPRSGTIANLVDMSWVLGETMGDDSFTQETDTHEQRRQTQRVFRYAAAIFALVEQKILVAAPERVERAAARRLRKAGARRPPAILVVRLRRAVREGDDADGNPRAWTCRWIVRGHWRQQYYPSDRSHRPVFILPHIKGPDGLPLRAPVERVFAVVR